MAAGTRTAWVLQEVAAARAGVAVAAGAGSALRADPVAWAYVLRDAVALAEPDLVLSHWDPALEADALAAGLAGDGSWVDRVLDGVPPAGSAPTGAAVELVRTLAGLPGYGGRVAVGVTPPAVVAAALGGALSAYGFDAGAPADREELTDLVADALGALITAYAQAGASVAVLAGPVDDARALLPLERAAGHARMTLVVPGTAGTAVLPPGAWGLEDEGAFGAAVRVAAAAAGAGGLLLGDGPVPAGVAPARLRAATPRR